MTKIWRRTEDRRVWRRGGGFGPAPFSFARFLINFLLLSCNVFFLLSLNYRTFIISGTIQIGRIHYDLKKILIWGQPRFRNLSDTFSCLSEASHSENNSISVAVPLFVLAKVSQKQSKHSFFLNLWKS